MKKKNNSYIKRIFIVFLVLYIGAFIYRGYIYPPEANSKKLNLITKESTNQGYHPKVIAFDKPWNGYTYWMAFTPYPYGDETKENPVINVSNDMKKWTEPDGINNPLDIPSPSDEKHYNSDTHILYNDDTNQIELFYRYVNEETNEVTIYKMTTSNGRNYSEKEIFLKSDNRKKLDYVSPTIIYDKGTYKIWYVDKREVYYFEKTNNNTTEPKKLNIKYDDNYRSWHIDVIYNKDKKQYELISCAYQDVNHREFMPLFYTSSSNNVDWSKPIKILEASKNKSHWDSQGLYRSSLLYINNKYYLFYSGHNNKEENGIGLVYGSDISKLKRFI